MALTTNNELFKAATNWADVASEGMAERFAERGVEPFTEVTDAKIRDDETALIMNMKLDRVLSETVKDKADRLGILETMSNAFGGIKKRMAVYNNGPISQRWRGLKTGDSVDMQKVRRNKVDDYLYKQNLDFSDTTTIFDDEYRTAVTDQYGVDLLTSAKTAQLTNNYIKTKWTSLFQTIFDADSSVNYPKKDTQKIVVGIDHDVDALTSEDCLKLVQTLQTIFEAMDIEIQSGKYNECSYPRAVNPENYVLLIRPGYEAAIRRLLITGAFHPETLSLGFKEIHTVPDFGGTYFTDSSDHRLYPHYDEEFGSPDGWSLTEGGEKAFDLGDPTLKLVDPRENIIAKIIQPGRYFLDQQCPFRVEPAPHNAAGHYTTFAADAYNATMGYDPHYDEVNVLKNNA